MMSPWLRRLTWLSAGLYTALGIVLFSALGRRRASVMGGEVTPEPSAGG
jgi:hypothetical protein